MTLFIVLFVVWACSGPFMQGAIGGLDVNSFLCFMLGVGIAWVTLSVLGVMGIIPITGLLTIMVALGILRIIWPVRS